MNWYYIPVWFICYIYIYVRILVGSLGPSRADLQYSSKAHVEQLWKDMLNFAEKHWVPPVPATWARLPVEPKHLATAVTPVWKWMAQIPKSDSGKGRNEAMGGVPSTFQVGISFDILTILPLKHFSYLLEGRSFHLPNFASTKGSNVVECMPSWTNLMHFEAAPLAGCWRTVTNLSLGPTHLGFPGRMTARPMG